MLRTTLLVIAILVVLESCTSNSTMSDEKLDSTQIVATAPINVPASLQGRWQRVSEPNQVIEIRDTSITDYYGEKKQLTRTFAYLADCSQTGCIGGKSRYGCFTTAGQFDIDCRTIVSLSATQLDVTMGGSTGEIAHYKKLP